MVRYVFSPSICLRQCGLGTDDELAGLLPGRSFRWGRMALSVDIYETIGERKLVGPIFSLRPFSRYKKELLRAQTRIGEFVRHLKTSFHCAHNHSLLPQKPRASEVSFSSPPYLNYHGAISHLFRLFCAACYSHLSQVRRAQLHTSVRRGRPVY
jgi:hypothetical protein